MAANRNDSGTRNLLAAVAREQIARGQPISPRALAALAGISEERVIDLIRTGEIRATENGKPSEARIEASEVTRWLTRGNPIGTPP